MTTTNQIRSTFLDFFEKRDHKIVKSSPLVPDNDPTLMFTNAGMVQFKNVFTGAETRDYNKACSTQKCVRAGGKHNDLDNVGYTARHHTFFEMLGNFSFGDYFKEQAILYAWELITKDLCIPKEKLIATVYKEDEQAFDLWKKISGLPESKIIKIPTKDNFWSMGETGPCGPCSEIFYDHGEHIEGGIPGSPNEDGDRFVEIWNLVFMQYEQVSQEQRVNLPNPSIDTGMGLERIAALMQGTHDNYQTDIFQNIINVTQDITNCSKDGEFSSSHKVIADHLRSVSFLIADGVLPSNEGRGYVLRRIMRRAMRHAHMMGCKDPLMYQLVPTLINQMGEAFPELVRARALITETLKSEEAKFKQMLARGLKLLDKEVQDISDGTLKGKVAFKLYDTYGFPLDLTQDALRSKGYKVDVEGFNQAMEKQKQEARKAWAGSGDDATDKIWFEIREDVGATDFLGYTNEKAQGVIKAIVEDNKKVDKAMPNAKIAIVANQTPFYGEAGGQVGDKGVINIGDDALVVIEDTKKLLGDMHVHIGTVEGGIISVGDEASFEIDVENRNQIRANHSVTHLLHAALREVLGEHVSQKGSLVSSDRLRFDLSHPKQITQKEIKKIEKIVNYHIRKNAFVDTQIMSPDEAIQAGAMALFGEKYGDEVRVVSMGFDDDNFTIELCGGTHVKRTGDIGFFKIISEGAVSSGVRRIEALTGRGAEKYIQEKQDILHDLSEELKVSPNDVLQRVKSIIADRKKLEKQLVETRKKLASGGGSKGSSAEVEKVKNISFSGKFIEGMPPKDLKGTADEIKKQIGSGVVALVTSNGGKATLVVGVTDDIKDKINAVDLVKAGSQAVGGKGGGGRPDMAQAGGPNGEKGNEAIKAIKDKLSELA